VLAQLPENDPARRYLNDRIDRMSVDKCICAIAKMSIPVKERRQMRLFDLFNNAIAFSINATLGLILGSKLQVISKLQEYSENQYHLWYGFHYQYNCSVLAINALKYLFIGC
jgi:hypothetical protein